MRPAPSFSDCGGQECIRGLFNTWAALAAGFALVFGDKTNALKDGFEPTQGLAALFAEGQFFQGHFGVVGDDFDLDFFGGGELEKRECFAVFASIDVQSVESVGEVNGERHGGVLLGENALQASSGEDFSGAKGLG